jgi:hypothetical protein
MATKSLLREIILAVFFFSFSILRAFLSSSASGNSNSRPVRVWSKKTTKRATKKRLAVFFNDILPLRFAFRGTTLDFKGHTSTLKAKSPEDPGEESLSGQPSEAMEILAEHLFYSLLSLEIATGERSLYQAKGPEKPILAK